MLSLQEAIDLDFAASSCGARDLDVIASGFTPWGPDTCPSLEQVMASGTPASAAAAAGEEAGGDEEDEERRRQRRKISNRLSAQRSRARKQQRLEELRAEAARLRAEKDGLAARLHAVARHGLAVRGQNARLRAEAAALARRLREARRLLALQRLAQLVPPPAPLPRQAGAAVGLASLMT
ncbi:hypothetical protein ACP4OV_008262 [Aristida adscensionis]